MKKDILILVFVFSGVVLVLIGAEGSDRKALENDPLALICLITVPVLISLGVLSMRKMKEMHYMVVTSYSSLFMALFSIILIVAQPDQDFQFLKELTAS